MEILELLKALILGIVEGITEWLPVSSTGHMILVDEFLSLDVSPQFREMFLVVIQLGAIFAVVVLYFWKLFPFTKEEGKVTVKTETISMWLKIVVSCIPAAIVGLLFDERIDALFYNWQTVSVMLILFGIFFILIERYNRKKTPVMNSLASLSYRAALLIGLFQLVAAVFPGTSRSGATILGALLIGVSRTVAAEYTFFLAIPVMFGASALKLVKFGFDYSGEELAILAVGMFSAFAVSVFAIRFLMGYIKKHDFTVFGWYRIVLGALVIVYFAFLG